MEFFCTAELASPVAALYGPQLTCKLTIATAEWLKAVGQVPDQWKQTVPYTAAPAAPAAPTDKASKYKTGAAAVPSAIEGVCLDRSAAMLQVWQQHWLLDVTAGMCALGWIELVAFLFT